MALTRFEIVTVFVVVVGRSPPFYANHINQIVGLGPEPGIKDEFRVSRQVTRVVDY